MATSNLNKMIIYNKKKKNVVATALKNLFNSFMGIAPALPYV